MNNAIAMTFKLSLGVFIRHYRHAPLQAGAILLGIILAVTLLIGVRATNENALRSYSEATELLSQRATLLLTPVAGKKHLTEAHYFALRQAGVSQALAVISGNLADQQGRLWQVQASDLVAALSLALNQPKSHDDTKNPPNAQLSLFSKDIPLAALLSGQPYVLMSQTLAKKIAPNNQLELAKQSLTVIPLDDNLGLGNMLLMDISLGQRLLNMPNRLSYIALFSQEPSFVKQVSQILTSTKTGFKEGKTFELSVQDKGESLTGLTRSFHLNLTAMSLLAFIVGLFIAYNGVRYSLLKREKLLVQLKQQGIPQLALFLALTAELLLLVIIGSVIGFILGLQLSHWLQPMVTVTLEQLYGARLLPGVWQWHWLWQAIGLTFLAAILACYSLFKRLSQQILARHTNGTEQQQLAYQQHKKLFKIAIGILTITACLFPFSQHYQYSLVLFAVVIIAIPLLLPFILQCCIAVLIRISPKGLVQYMVAETRELIAPLSLAMMAMLLALTANIAMNTLVSSFESTLEKWLDVRLYADIYVRPPSDKMPDVQQLLISTPNVSAVYQQWRHKTQYQGLPVNLMTRDKHSLLNSNQMKSVATDFWPQFFAGRQVMISEPMAIKHQLQLGSPILLPEFKKHHFPVMTVGAIFYDYGNPEGQVIINQQRWQQAKLASHPSSIAADYTGNIKELEQLLENNIPLSPQLMFNQSKIKQRAVSIFKRTFSITLVLNTLTLIVAAIGLFSACLMLTQARQAPLARLYTLGVTRRQLRSMVLVQMLLIVLITCFFALPTGALLGYLIIHKITLQAFGWSIAMLWSWLDYFQVLLIALLACGLSVALPLYWQTRRPLIASLQQEVL